MIPIAIKMGVLEWNKRGILENPVGVPPFRISDKIQVKNAKLHFLRTSDY